ncbi:hypothetical protein GLOTRDRAFT_39420 [Gloeophyllum trabeum ATCC 11539]|uniref:Uncharacterized protein n=1 Tax=Gloeophyllum trabeum (strain ATCC 11539 / FP-39264 / Madison 617) TaxID=670483 RepID=S7QBA4_GLOTA|nr:uncharacterized protein GLOTRDRAFT_39420 [Gloeophyllum trabeum ATCC 11539]EPQ56607.1 hypothetical protein GLOTRDRAFT_39420 [Gloeophyllum trabeum ATCC 11539]
MCYKIIQYVEYRCSHQYPTREQIVDCNSRNCRLSSLHRSDAHDCPSICRQE